MPEVTDDELRKHLRETLKNTDLASTTERKLRTQLEEHFGCSLKPRKAVFKEEIESFLAQCNDINAESEEEQGGEGEEEPKKKKVRAGPPVSLSAEMQAFLGVEADAKVSRGDVVKSIWAYIHEHNLQNPADKRKFLKDDKLATIFTYPVDMLSMQKQVSRHCKRTADIVGEGDPPAKKAKTAKSKPAKAKAEGGEAKKTGFNKEMRLSPQLAELLGVETASRGDCSKRMWAYFKEKNLQVCCPTDMRVPLQRSTLPSPCFFP